MVDIEDSMKDILEALRRANEIIRLLLNLINKKPKLSIKPKTILCSHSICLPSKDFTKPISLE